MMKNSKYFPRTTEVFEDSKKIGVKDYKEFYKIPNLKNHLNEIFTDEYRTYIKNEDYFPGCPLKIYRKTYHERLEDYQLTYPDADEFDFLKYEDAIIHRLYLMDVERKDNFYPFYPYLFSDPHWKNFDLSVKKTRSNFIDKRIIELDHFFYVTGVDPIDYDRVPREHFELRRNPNARDTETPQFFEYRKPTLEKVSDPNYINKEKQTKSLKWNDKEYSKLSNIYKALEYKGYVNCGLRDFKRIFSDTREFQPMEWLGKKRSLYYFYGLLIDRKLIEEPDAMWLKLPEVFTNSKGISPKSAKTEWNRAKKDEGNFELFNSIESLIDKA